ncbi:MAG: fasciclin domain-containing protein [Bacteroidetes bacterium]|nr:fasciclin domain-containing protein [Bacteroidota bacterium]
MKRITYILPLFLLATVLSSTAIAGGEGTVPSKKNIVTVAVEAGSFTTLAKALTATGLVDALKGDGPFTVFAPTDEAFAKLPKGTLEGLLKDKEALKEILLYHVVKGNVGSKAVKDLKSATTLSGMDVHIAVKDGNVMINSAKVISADVAASNGVIHVIDQVLIPHKH